MSATAPLRIELHYDHASALCYVAQRVLARLAGWLDELAVELVWSPIDLSRLTGWRAGARLDPVRLADLRAIAAELGTSPRVPERWQDSRRVGSAASALLARPDGAGPRLEAVFREHVFTHVYEQGGRCDDAALAERVLARIGCALDEADFAAGERELDERTEQAARRGVTGVPVFLLGDFPFSGIHDEGTLRSVLGRFAARQRAAS